MADSESTMTQWCTDFLAKWDQLIEEKFGKINTTQQGKKLKLESFEVQMVQKLTITVHPFIIYEYPNAIFEVVNLKQTGTIEDYYEELEGFCNMLQLDEEDALQIFINNLKPEIFRSVSFFYPKH